MIAQAMILLTIRMLRTRMPRGILEIKDPTRSLRVKNMTLETPRLHLNVSLESFKNQAPRLFNSLPYTITTTLESSGHIKKLVKEWVQENIKLKG